MADPNQYANKYNVNQNQYGHQQIQGHGHAQVVVQAGSGSVVPTVPGSFLNHAVSTTTGGHSEQSLVEHDGG